MAFPSRERLLAVIALAVLPACGGGTGPTPPPSPTPGAPARFVYVAAASSRELRAFSVDAGTGDLRPAGTTTLEPDTPLSVVADAAGRYLWVAASGGGFRTFAVDRSSGALAEVAGSPFDVANTAQALARDPASRFLFATRFDTRTVDVLSLDAATGAVRPVVGDALPLSGASIEPAVLTPDGRRLFAAVVTPPVVDVASFDTASGRLAPSGAATAVPDVPSCLTVDPAGTFLYVATATFLSSDTLFAYAIDPRTGALARVAGPALDPAFDAVAANLRPACVMFLPTGRLAYVADRPARTGASSHGYWAFPVQASGRLGPSSVGPFATPGGDPAGLAVDPSGRFAYAIDGRGGSVAAFAVDAATGALSLVGAPQPAGLFPSAVLVVP